MARGSNSKMKYSEFRCNKKFGLYDKVVIACQDSLTELEGFQVLLGEQEMRVFVPAV
jgi:hypothetical protein